MTTSQEIVNYFGNSAIEKIKKEFGYTSKIQINKDNTIVHELNCMVMSWYVDYGKKGKFPYTIENLINWVKSKKYN